MTPEEQAYVRYRIERAYQSLHVAQQTVTSGALHDAVNRLYYACFYAVTALLLTEGLSATKHQGVTSLFDKYWVVSGRFPREMGKFFHRMLDARLDADYEDMAVFTADEVAAWAEEAEAFIKRAAEQVEIRIQQGQEERGTD